ncbi:energy-coupling factor transporter transmembrane component T [Auritidibacter ignavus]
MTAAPTTEHASAITLGEDNRTIGLDPRTSMVLVILASTAVMGPYGPTFVLPALILAVALAVSERAWHRACVLPAIVAVAWALGWGLAHAPVSPVVASAVMMADYTARFAVTIGVAMHLLASTSPARLNAALRSVRVPRSASVTLIVMIRFLPVVMTESAAVLDAMRLRGLTRLATVLRHPLLVVERFTVPMIAASLRASEDLAAAAVLRGLGSPHRPTSLVPARLGWIDVVWLTMAAVLAVVAVVLPGTLA